jgi:hypothetical protein
MIKLYVLQKQNAIARRSGWTASFIRRIPRFLEKSTDGLADPRGPGGEEDETDEQGDKTELCERSTAEHGASVLWLGAGSRHLARGPFAS